MSTLIDNIINNSQNKLDELNKILYPVIYQYRPLSQVNISDMARLISGLQDYIKSLATELVALKLAEELYG